MQRTNAPGLTDSSSTVALAETHAVHTAEPGGENDPDGHAVHADDPTLEALVLAGQSVHAAEPAAPANDPAGHGVAPADPDGQ